MVKVKVDRANKLKRVVRTIAPMRAYQAYMVISTEGLILVVVDEDTSIPALLHLNASWFRSFDRGSHDRVLAFPSSPFFEIIDSGWSAAQLYMFTTYEDSTRQILLTFAFKSRRGRSYDRKMLVVEGEYPGVESWAWVGPADHRFQARLPIKFFTEHVLPCDPLPDPYSIKSGLLLSLSHRGLQVFSAKGNPFFPKGEQGVDCRSPEEGGKGIRSILTLDLNRAMESVIISMLEASEVAPFMWILTAYSDLDDPHASPEFEFWLDPDARVRFILPYDSTAIARAVTVDINQL